MKILMITPYVTINSLAEFSRNKTGFGYMVLDIAKAVGKLEQVEVLATDSRGKDFEYEDVKFLQRSYGLFISSLFYSLSPFVIVRLWKQYHMKSGTFLRLAYYWMLTGYLRKLLKGRQYDVVHIHGCGFSTELWMQVCKKLRQKYVVTLHGLNSFSDSVKLEPAGKRYERDFLKRVTKDEFPITVISTGIKRTIEKTFGVDKCKSIMVVCNSFNFEENTENVAIREKYNIPKEGKILLYVGNISENKNQKQLIDAFGIVPKRIRDNTWILICGCPSNDGSFEKHVKAMPYSDHIALCGSIEKSHLVNFYKEADGVVLLSMAEGFGLSLIEGMHFGVPCAMFNDMDAFDDIYDKRAVVAIESRDNETVAQGITHLLEKSWDKSAIEECSHKFENKTMSRNYIAVYEKIG